MQRRALVVAKTSICGVAVETVTPAAGSMLTADVSRNPVIQL
jgi:hypothetical protein